MTFKKNIKLSDVDVESSGEFNLFEDNQSEDVPDASKVTNLFSNQEEIAKKRVKNGGSSVENEIVISRSRAIESIQSLKILSPLILRFLSDPKIKKMSNQDKKMAWLDIVETNRSDALLLENLLTNNVQSPKNKWLNGMAQRFVSELNAMLPEGSKVDWSDDIMKDVVESIDVEIKEKFETMSSNTFVKMEIIKATSKVLIAYKNVDLMHPEKTVELNIKRMIDGIVHESMNSIDKIVTSVTPEKERHILFNVLLGESVSILIDEIKKADVMLHKVLKNMIVKHGEKEGHKMLMEKRPDGYPVSSILDLYKKSFSKLINVSKHYTPVK